MHGAIEKPGGSADFRWVATHSDLRALGASLAAEPRHALDTESNSGFVFRERLCLLQFNVAGRLWIVDLLRLGDGPQAIEPIRGPLESAGVRTILHGGEFDVGCFKRDFDLQLGGVWDTQQAASFLGWDKTGYGSVVEAICGVTLDKGFAHYDWGRRPLAEEALDYALDDVRFLPQIAESLAAQIERADLVEELAIANGAVMQATWNAASGVDAIWRTKGVRSLPQEALPNLVALWEWRESVARVEDLPPGRILNAQLMLAVARRAPRRRRELKAAGLRGRSSRYAADLLDVLRRAAASPPAVPEPPRGMRQTPGESRRLKRLRQWRRAEAERRGLPQQVVLPPTAMQYLARHGAESLDDVPQLGSKRSARYGDRLREICR